MAGATATILFPAQARGVAAFWKSLIADRAIAVEEGAFWIPPSEPGGAAPGFYSHVVLADTPEWEIGDEESESILTGFGFIPGLGISLGAMSRGVESDRVLGELALSALKPYEGVLLFHGLLSPTLEPMEWRDWHGKSLLERAAQFSDVVGPHPGRVVATTIEGEPSYHVVDKEFLAFWLQHRAFHCVN